MTKQKKNPIHQLTVSLRHVEPAIWRRIQVKSNATLEELHAVIQYAMGWTNSHMHQFVIKKVYYGMPGFGMDDTEDESQARLNEVVPRPRTKFLYEYDFGDSWLHEIVVDKILEADPEQRYPVCLEGEGACPLEDCGGPWGYMEILDVLGDKEHPDYEETVECYGEIEPDDFDCEKANAELLSLNLP